VAVEPEVRLLIPGEDTLSPAVSIVIPAMNERITMRDFVRWCKQTIDLLDQIADVAAENIAATARDASRSVLRGIVAYSSV
jgi:superfamily II RNA helicase